MDRFGNFYILVADDEAETQKFKIDFGLMMEDYFNTRHPEWKFICVADRKKAIKMTIDEGEFRKEVVRLFPEIKEESKIFLDLVILDIEFPDQQKGFEIAEAIREEKVNLPIIFFSHHEDPETIIKTLTKDYAHIDYCTKSKVFGYKDYKFLEEKIQGLFESTGRFLNKDGILITHGTDTMAWGFAILRYALKGLKTNVAITGSQMPLEGFYSPSDAIGNLKTALYLLSRLRPSNIFVVFNNGKTVFSSHLQKVRKWDFDAFTGKIVGRMVWEHMNIYNEGKHRKHCLCVHPEPRLKHLYLLRTGGTIEAEKDPITGALKPTGDFVGGYIHTSLKKDFVDDVLSPYPSLKKDSSTLSIEDWLRVANWIKEITKCDIDDQFDWRVQILWVNPFSLSEQYLKMFQATESGIILLGYGAGNANIDENSTGTIIPALVLAREKEKIVVASSQVPLETYDFDYETGRKLLEYGAVPSGSLSYPEAQVKLAYILGHEDEINYVLEKYRSLSRYQLIKSAFLAGVEFRKEESKREYEKITQTANGGPPIRVMAYDPFSDTNKTFNQAIEEVARFQLGL